MQDFVKWANGSATKRNVTVGPRHDPYSRDTVEVRLRDRTYTIVSCGLAGEYLILPSGEEIHLLESPFSDNATIRRNRENYEAEVIRHTGFDSRFWMEQLWEKRDRAWERRDPEGYWLSQEMHRYITGYM